LAPPSRPPRLRFAILGSGSTGNAAVIAAGRTCVLLDCGLSLRETEYRLHRLGLEAGSLAAILVTHEHSDHVGGLGPLTRRFGLPVWMTEGTRAAIGDRAGVLSRLRTFSPHDAFEIGDLAIAPFPVPHDAREPAQFVFGNGHHRLGFMTDIGSTTAVMEQALSGCDALVLECNHDLGMLERGDYPPPLKARIRGERGHLDNATAARLLGRLDRSRLQHLVAAHLSQRNNRPALARAALAEALGGVPDWLDVADPDIGLDWREIV
jgi:phosphoribosyl 1,2-cyclic phosphodiesterase